MTDPAIERPIVIGGGLAGLVAALHLAERGLRPLVLEAGAQAGGRLVGGRDVTLEAGGQSFTFPGEHGIHGVWGGYRNLTALLAQYGLASQLIPARHQDWIYGEGTRVSRAELGSAVIRSALPAPFHPLSMFLRPRFWGMLRPRDLLYLPVVAGTVAFAVGVDPIGEDLPLHGRTMQDLTGDWPPRLRAFISALGRSGLTDHAGAVPLSGFLAFLRFYTVLRRDSQAFRFFPTDPYSFMLAPWLARIAELGGTVQTGAQAQELTPTAGGWQVRWTGADGTPGGLLDAGAVVLATDAPATLRLLRASPALDGTEQLNLPLGLPTGSMRLWWSRRPRRGAEAGLVSGNFAIDNFFWLDRFQPQFMAWADACGGSACEVQIYGPPAVLAQPEADLLAQVIADVERAWPELRGSLLHAVAWVNPPAHTLFGVGPADAHLATVTPWPGLYACGDWVRHPSPSLYMERATTTGLAAANALLESRGLPPLPILDPLPPELPARLVAWGVGSLRHLVHLTQGR
jgi:isorenieratene synthase